MPRGSTAPPMHTPGAGQGTSDAVAHSEGRTRCRGTKPLWGDCSRKGLAVNHSYRTCPHLLPLPPERPHSVELPQCVREREFTEAVVVVYCWSQMSNETFSYVA